MEPKLAGENHETFRKTKAAGNFSWIMRIPIGRRHAYKRQYGDSLWIGLEETKEVLSRVFRADNGHRTLVYELLEVPIAFPAHLVREEFREMTVLKVGDPSEACDGFTPGPVSGDGKNGAHII